jgi:hypothetical protein
MRRWILFLALAVLLTPALAGKSSSLSVQPASSRKISSSRPKPAKVAKDSKATKVAKATPNQPRKAAQRAKAPKPAKNRKIFVYCATCVRDSRSEAKRAAVRRAFQKSHPCPATGMKSGACPGYVVDYVVPLTSGGADKPSNMRWQTVAEVLAQDGLQ